MDLTPAQTSEARYRAMADPVRRHILRVLEDSSKPCDIAGLAETVELHPNTVRGHLDVLERAGLVSRSRQVRSTPGRPRLLYDRAPDSGDPTPGGYRLLAEMLTTTVRLSSEDPAGAAREAGHRWGYDLAARIPTRGDLTPQETISQIAALLDDFGFDPRPRPGGDKTIIELSDCPFRDLARQHGDIICTLHLGLMTGAAEALGGGVVIESLEPFVEPSLCRTVIRPA